MASIIKVGTLQDITGNNSISMQFVSSGTDKAYCDADHTTNTINQSLNQSSQTDTATGKKTHNWTSAFTTATYVGRVGMCGNRGAATGSSRFCVVDGTWTTTAAVVRYGHTSNTQHDDTHASASWLGDLA